MDNPFKLSATGIVNFYFGTYSQKYGKCFRSRYRRLRGIMIKQYLVLEYDGEFDRFDIVELTETSLQFRGTYFECM